MFRHNFFGLCVWKHMNNNSCWVKSNDLNANVSANAVKMFHDHLKNICIHNSKLFWKLMSNDDHSIRTAVVQVYCDQVHNSYNSGTWSDNSDNIEGIFHKHYKLLDVIEFPLDE